MGRSGKECEGVRLSWEEWEEMGKSWNFFPHREWEGTGKNGKDWEELEKFGIFGSGREWEKS